MLPHTHYLMVASQTGIGRNWLTSLLARVWAGATRLGFDLVGAMQSGFNGALSRRLLVIVDELKAADTSYGTASHAQQLKTMLTVEHRGINPKFGRQHIEFNCARWLMLSQHYDALPLERADRRVIVITNPTERRSTDYYAAAYARLDDADFVQAVGHWLAARDIRGFNPSEPAPLTASKAKAIDACVSDLERALTPAVHHDGGIVRAGRDRCRRGRRLDTVQRGPWRMRLLPHRGPEPARQGAVSDARGGRADAGPGRDGDCAHRTGGRPTA